MTGANEVDRTAERRRFGRWPTIGIVLVIAAATVAAAVDADRDRDDVRADGRADLERVAEELAGAVAGDQGSPDVALPVGEVTTSPSFSIGNASTPSLSGGGSEPIGDAPSGSAINPPPDAASPPAPPENVSVAVLTPLLSIQKFGATVGFLLVCNTSAGALSATATQVPGLTEVLTPVIQQISPLCDELSAQAVAGLNMLNAQLGILQGLNPTTDAFFDLAAAIFEQLDMLAPHLDPLGGAITGLGPFVEFFSGRSLR